MKTDNYIREAAENFNVDVKDGWGNENGLILQGLGIQAKRKENENARRVLDNLLAQIPYTYKYAGIACFYEMEFGELEVRDRIKYLLEELKKNFDDNDDEMALVFYMKYETKLGGKEHYQDVYKRYCDAAANPAKNEAYFMTAVIEGIESVDQAVYEYYDGLKRLFKESLKMALADDETDITDKALLSYSILKACRMKVILAEKYEKMGLMLYDEVIAGLGTQDVDRGAVVMLMAERALH